MGKRIHICKTVVDDIFYCSGKGKYNASIGSTAADIFGVNINYAPPLVQLFQPNIETITATEGSVPNELNIMAVKDESARIDDITLTIKNTATKTELQSTQYFRNGFIDKIQLSWTVKINYLAEGVTTPINFTLTALGSEFKNGLDIVKLKLEESFDNIYNSKPLNNISVNTGDAISFSYINTSTTMTTEAAIIIISGIEPIKVQSLTATKISADTNYPTLTSFKNPDKTMYGRLYLKEIKISEQPLNLLYSYQGLISSSSLITHFTEPAASQISTNESICQIKGLLAGYSTSNLLTQNFQHAYDDVDSSFDDSKIYTYGYYSDDINSWSAWPTNCSWKDLKVVAWYDAVLIRTDATGTYQDYPLIDVILDGIPVKNTKETINIQLIVPNLAYLGNQNFTNNKAGIRPDDFLGSFCPYNYLEVSLKMGYKTDGYVSGRNDIPGIFIGGTRIRRMFIGENEIESFVVDEET